MKEYLEKRIANAKLVKLTLLKRRWMYLSHVLRKLYTKTGMVLETIWKNRMPTRNLQTNHHERSTNPETKKQRTFKEWLQKGLDGVDCSQPCVPNKMV